jgi:hypothetical protein
VQTLRCKVLHNVHFCSIRPGLCVTVPLSVE